MDTTTHSLPACRKAIMGVHDAIYVLGGKWKIQIVTSLLFGTKRYSDILREVEGISGKMLSRELKEMEINQLVKRTVLDTQPITVNYELTKYGQTLEPIIGVLANWGMAHRKRILAKS